MKKTRKRRKSTREKEAQARKRRRNILIAFMCVCLILVGYIGADAFMIRHARPVDKIVSEEKGTDIVEEKAVAVTAASLEVPSIALDNSVMLSSVTGDALDGGFNSVTFDLKRDDGTIGYNSRLTAVDTFGGISSPAAELHESLNSLNKKGIKPIGRIACLKDNIVPKKSPDMAIKDGDKVYEDGEGNTYLDPDSESAYKYLKEIVGECYTLGVKTVILTDCTLPKAVREEHNDGFERLSKRLKADIGSDIVFLQQVEVGVDIENNNDNNYYEEDYGYGEGEAEAEAGFAADFPKLESYQIYLIETDDDNKALNEKLSAAGVNAYVIKNNK